MEYPRLHGLLQNEYPVHAVNPPWTVEKINLLRLLTVFYKYLKVSLFFHFIKWVSKKVLIISINYFHYYLLGHFWTLQDSFAKGGPSHSDPPYRGLGSLHVLLRVLVPPLHGSVQFVHDDHSEKLPFTKNNKTKYITCILVLHMVQGVSIAAVSLTRYSLTYALLCTCWVVAYYYVFCPRSIGNYNMHDNNLLSGIILGIEYNSKSFDNARPLSSTIWGW